MSSFRKPIFVGIAGGTGAGKSTLCTAFQDKYPDTVGLVQLDDYFKPQGEVPILDGLVNWDDPAALDFSRFIQDLSELSQGRSVTIHTKNERLNPDFKKTQIKVPVEFRPKPIMLVEGYLVLWDTGVRDFLSTSIWLDVDHATRWERRVHFKFAEYETKVLLPMHRQYVEPTKRFAKHVISVSGLTAEQVFQRAETLLQARLVS